MSSKGIDFFSTIHGLPDLQVRTRLRVVHSNGSELTFTSHQDPHQRGHLEVDSGGLSIFESSKEVRLTVEAEGEVVGYTQLIDTRWPKLNDGPFSNTYTTPSGIFQTIGGRIGVSYGFGDNSGHDGVSSVVYVTVTPEYSGWMGQLVAAHPELADRPFSDIVLPGAHNAGMTQPGGQAVHEVNVLRDNDVLPLPKIIPNFVARDLIATATINSAFTQKDDLETMLALGIRFFDFRPGVFQGNPTLRHVHNVVPGQGLLRFLQTLLQWLRDHPTEIAVVKLSNSGVDAAALPAEGAVERCVQDAFRTAVVDRGDATDLTRTTSELLHSRKRLLVIGNDHCYGSWNNTYRTTDPQIVLDALKKMTASGQDGMDHTVMELQTSGTDDGVKTGAKNTAAGELIKMKPYFGSVLYPWVRQDAATAFPSGTLVLSDDFADGALTRLAIDVTTSRLK
ncbi:hypothetical protein FKR81_02780 [Lentzea tibetensis]|uniref:PLC-like phosphodiesterase n=1 Tax=Lentzea tibetensis TaxID=2591470 RepID=A0A563F1A7_9PSEU|nr:hypothetical protein [Lentzea tibetensis]TWP53699.1 hypothetical protein FKR81_02780 [Lentzea tibetensis]